MELTLQEKRKLINLFEFLLNEEISKPLGEMNSEAVDSYINILLYLQSKHAELSPEYIDEQVRKLFPEEDAAAPETAKTTKKQINKKKVWLVAACIAILVALFSIVSVANDWNVFDFLSEKFGSVHSAPVEEKQDFNGISVFMNGNSTTYTNIQKAFEAEKLALLYPTVLPDGIAVTKTMIYKELSIEKIIYIFNDANLSSEIYFKSPIEQSIINDATEIIKINSIVCYICEMPDINRTQITFEHNGDKYIFSYTNKDTLIEVIENLEEINNES